MEQTKYDVFISYSRKDYVDEHGNVIPGNEVSKIMEALTNAGISYWFDQEGIYSGQNFVERIVTNIENAKIFIFLSTANANKTPWTCKEIASADEFKKHIIPVRIDSSPYNKKVLFRIADLDYIEYYANPQKGIEDLIKSVKSYLDEFAAEERRKREEQERKRLEEEKRLEDERQKKILQEQKIKKEQESIVNDIELRCTQLNNEESKLELDRTNLLLTTERVVDQEVRDGLKEKIASSSPIRKKAIEGYRRLQEEFDKLVSFKSSLEKENVRLKVQVSDLHSSQMKLNNEYQECASLLERKSADIEKMQKKLSKTTDELELAKRGIVKPSKVIHVCYISIIILLLLGFYYLSQPSHNIETEREEPDNIEQSQLSLLDDSIDAAVRRLSTIHPDLQNALVGYKQNNLELIYLLAKFFEKGELFEGRSNTFIAGKLMHIAADGGYADAQNALGNYFFYGRNHYVLNYDSAVSWYSKAVINGSLDAQYRLAVAYDDGCYTGTKKRSSKTSKALYLYKESAMEGDPRSAIRLGKYYYEQGKKSDSIADYFQAKDWFEISLNGEQNKIELSQQEKGIAQFYMGQLFGSNHLGIENRDYSKAFDYYKMAAQNGHVKAAFYLGRYYQEGKGIKKPDYSEALHWLTFAKNNGDLDAKRALEQGAR